MKRDTRRGERLKNRETRYEEISQGTRDKEKKRETKYRDEIHEWT
jgi:hypothetical protein